jgi:endonuclease III
MSPSERPSPLTLFDYQDDALFSLSSLSREQQIPDDYVPEVLPPTGERLVVTIDKAHAYPILDTLLEAYANNEPPYNLDRARLPQDPRHMPASLERGSTDHAMFLFNVCYYMRGGIKSNDAVRRMATIYDDHPELFNCEYAQLVQTNELEEILTTHGLGFQKAVAKQWIENSRRLQTEYEGDPRRIFDGVTSYEQSQERIQNQRGQGFMGFQEKMTSMIIYYLMDEGLIEPFNFPIPVDLHVMRVSIANRMVNFIDQQNNPVPNGTNLYTKETLAALRKLYFEYAQERGVNPLRLCDAVWMLSESSCGRHPGNVTVEPLGRSTRNGRKTYLIPKEVNEHDPAQQKAYAESCGICPIENTCELNIPGTQYYVGGNIIVRGERKRFALPEPIRSEIIEPLF